MSSLTEEKTVQFSLFSDNSKWEKKNKIDDLTYELRKKHGYNIIRDTIGITKGDKDDNRGFNEIGDYRTIAAVKSLYRET